MFFMSNKIKVRKHLKVIKVNIDNFKGNDYIFLPEENVMIHNYCKSKTSCEEDFNKLRGQIMRKWFGIYRKVAVNEDITREEEKLILKILPYKD